MPKECCASAITSRCGPEPPPARHAPSFTSDDKPSYILIVTRPSNIVRRSRSPLTPPAAFQRKRERIRIQHEAGSAGFTTCLRLTRLTDTLIQGAFQQYAAGAPIAVIALGGYGRQELCFGSDIDTMVLTPGTAGTEEMKEFYHGILDYGLDVGHSYRTIDDCVGLLETDIDAWIAQSSIVL